MADKKEKAFKTKRDTVEVRGRFQRMTDAAFKIASEHFEARRVREAYIPQELEEIPIRAQIHPPKVSTSDQPQKIKEPVVVAPIETPKVESSFVEPTTTAAEPAKKKSSYRRINEPKETTTNKKKK